MVDEQAITRSPMERVRQPKTPIKLIPVLRDEAIIRLYANTGARLSEVGNLLIDDVDLNSESVHYHGKGARDRRVRFGPKTARAISRYLRVRDRHKAARLPSLWLAERGTAPGDTGDLMLLLGWTSDDMPRHYGASAAERAQQTQVRLGIGERI